MAIADRFARRIDEFQQRFLAYPVAVFVKFGDDQAGNLAALTAYYSFVSIFPLFLVFATVLGYVLHDHPALDHRLLHSAVIDFPLIGDQIKESGLTGHWYTLVISFAISVWGAQGLARAIQTAFNTLWNVPFADRPNFAGTLARSVALTTVMGLSILVTGLLSGVGSLSGSLGIALRVIAFLASVVINVGAFLLAFRVATARTVRFADFARSAVVAALVWQALLAVASLLVAHEVAHQQELYGTVGVVLGLLAWLNVQAVLTLLAVEADVVRARRLWPRSVTPPPLTRADRRAYRAYAKTTMRLPEDEVTVNVEFTSPPSSAQLP
jgi:YihY family inner membrane protein